MSRAAGSLAARAVHELPVRESAAVRVCYALPPRRAGPVNLTGWWPSFGAGLTLAEARRRASAEAIERACAVFQGDEPVFQASYRELGAAAVHPDELLLWSASQRRRRPASGSLMLRVPPRFEERRPIAWSPAWSLTRREWRYLPSMAVYFRYPVASFRRYCPADSNGIAAGRTRGEAALRALLELVERDSVSLWWYNRARRPAFSLAGTGDRRLGRLLRFYEEVGREVWVLDLTSDLGVPVAAAISRLRSGPREDLAFGFGAGLAAGGAVRHALLEMAQVVALREAGGRGGEGGGPFERWRRHARAAGFPHLLPAGRSARRVAPAAAPLPGPAAGLRRCAAALEARGLELLACDLTRRAAPLAVVRMVVPGLRHLWPRLAPGRLYDAPVAAGWRPRPLEEAALNAVPLLL